MAAPNRSLDGRGRRVCLVVIAATAVGIGAGAAALGAWPVLPFAGLEVLVVAAAFRSIARHDGDYERLEITGARVRLQRRHAARLLEFEGNMPWARLIVEDFAGRCRLCLRYAGRTVEFGRLISERRRREWAAELGRRLPVTRT